MQDELKALQQRLGTTFVFVTHDQTEAFTISDRIALMNAGRVEQVGSPRALYERPASRFAAMFMGDTNLIEGRVAASGLAVHLEPLVAELGLSAGGLPPGTRVAVSLRPEQIEIGPTEAERVRLQATVAGAVFQGPLIKVILQAERGLRLQALVVNKHPLLTL